VGPSPLTLLEKNMLPDDRKYSKEHEWIKIDGDNGTIGITDFAQKELGDVVYVELPEVGAAVTAMEVFGNIESVKAVSELFSPASGEVVEINNEVVDAPELVNADPHGDAWLVVLKLRDPSELDALMSAAEYQKYIDEEQKD
jgi:glycine cleavage system H protein